MTTTLTDTAQITALLAELRTATDAVTSKEWLSGDLASAPRQELGKLGENAQPLEALSSAGVGFLTPMISFLEEPLNRLRGNPDAVSSGAGEFGKAADGTNALAEEYRTTAGKETDGWSGQAKTDYLKTGTEIADGISSVAETALTSAKAMIAAGEVVAQVVGVVTQLITEAVGRIVPIMTQAIAAAPSTFGQSIAVAIPQCVQIAVDCGVQIAGKLAELLASGENLIKLVEGALAVLKVVRKALEVIGDKSQSQGGVSAPAPA